jgi:Transposase DDE domain
MGGMSKRAKTSKRKASTVRHTRAIQRDRSQRPIVAPPAEQVTARLTELILPATQAQQATAHQTFGLRARTLTPVVMMAFVISLIWRQVGNVSEGVQLLNSEGLLWVAAVAVTQQAVSLRLGSLPAELFLQVLVAVLPMIQARWQVRQRPLPPELAWAKARYTQVVAADGSTLDALLRKTGLLLGALVNPLAGRMTALIDLCSRLPGRVWYEPDPNAHDQRWWPQIVAALKPGALLIVDLGYTNFKVFAQLTVAQIKFITRAKSNLAYQVERYLRRSANVHDMLIWVGTGEERQLIRLIQVLYRGKWYRYLTNELDAQQLPTQYVVALYWQRWRIEDAYAIVKRLLGLAYFWNGSENGVCLQLWATWMLYAVLVDLTDAVAEALKKPFAAISMEMVYRSLYFFHQAMQRGQATDLIAYLVANAERLGLLKRKRKRLSLDLLLTLTMSAEP